MECMWKIRIMESKDGNIGIERVENGEGYASKNDIYEAKFINNYASF